MLRCGPPAPRIHPQEKEIDNVPSFRPCEGLTSGVGTVFRRSLHRPRLSAPAPPRPRSVDAFQDEAPRREGQLSLELSRELAQRRSQQWDLLRDRRRQLGEGDALRDSLGRCLPRHGTRRARADGGQHASVGEGRLTDVHDRGRDVEGPRELVLCRRDRQVSDPQPHVSRGRTVGTARIGAALQRAHPHRPGRSAGDVVHWNQHVPPGRGCAQQSVGPEVLLRGHRFGDRRERRTPGRPGGDENHHHGR